MRPRRRTPALVAFAVVVIGARVPAQTPALQSGSAAARHIATTADSAAIRETALDYIEGWYEGNAVRMERALHPELAKRIVRTDPKSGRSGLASQSALTLINGTKAGGGTRTPEARRLKDVRILDIFENAASVRVEASDWIDYLHIAKWNGRWVIVNVLWELKPEAS